MESCCRTGTTTRLATCVSVEKSVRLLRDRDMSTLLSDLDINRLRAAYSALVEESKRLEEVLGGK